MNPWWIWAVGAGILLAVLYAGGCLLRPFAFCWRCAGAGRRESRSLMLRRPVFRNCWWCAGSGRRMRVGRRIWNYFHRLRKEGS